MVSSSNQSLSAQERHFADQIDSLLERVNLLEKFLGGRWHVDDAARATPETFDRRRREGIVAQSDEIERQLDAHAQKASEEQS